jgi:hypothetical protein
MKLILPFLFCLLCLQGFTQRPAVDVDKDRVDLGFFFQTVNGEPIVPYKFVRLTEGTPFFKEEWMLGYMYFANGGYARGLMKLDLFHNKVHYKDSAENEFVANMPNMQRISLKAPDTVYSFVHASLLQGVSFPRNVEWCLRLYKGDSVQLYAFFQKDMSEYKNYGSATTEQTITTRPAYLLMYKDKSVIFKLLKDVPALVTDYKEILTSYLNNADNKKASSDKRAFDMAAYLDKVVGQR